MVAIPETFNPNDFWQLWQEYRDYLYARCLKWMGGNPMEAEDALSRAMLKAWEKVQQYAGKISNLKGWLTRLTHNLCVDIHREHSRGANRVEDIEAIPEEKEFVSCEDRPFSALETEERKMAIRGAIDNLPIRLRETFILHFYQQFSHQEIVQEQEISYANVCKRISQARKILREQLRKHFIEENETDNEKSNQTEDVLIESSTSISALGEKKQKEALSHQPCSNLTPAGEAEPNEKTSQAYVKFEPFVSKTVSKQISKENHSEEKEELSVQKKFSVSMLLGKRSVNFNQCHFSPQCEEVFLKLKALLSPFGITRFYTDALGTYKRCLIPETHVISKHNTQKIENKHLNLRTRIKRLARKTICFSKSVFIHDIVIGLFINRYEFGILI